MTTKAAAKVNIFLKITGTRGGYHELRSRFMRVDSCHDTITFIPKKSKSTGGLNIVCDTPLPKQNTLTKAYDLLCRQDSRVEKFFTLHSLHLQKRIPMGAGLGGGSSDAGAFLNLVNRVCKLNLSKPILASIAKQIGADVPFFVYEYQSANVEGIGDIIQPFEEDPITLQMLTPPVHCDTSLVYKTFRDRFMDTIDPNAEKKWLETPSKKVMQRVSPIEANDLLKAACIVYPKLLTYKTYGFFSGSGSTFFKGVD